MGIEIDFIGVGRDSSKPGDAIALRFGNLFGRRSEQTVITIDGGTQESGRALVQHVQRYYETDYVDIGFGSHPDIDHVSGMTELLSGLRFGQICMHRPWEHSADLCALFEGRPSVRTLDRKLKIALDKAWEVEKRARRRGIEILEPFTGMSGRLEGGTLRVLGPSRPYYRSLLPFFSRTPEPSGLAQRLQPSCAAEGVALAVEPKWITETWERGTLDAGEDTQPQNNTSLVLLLEVEGRKYLLTADAGQQALWNAIQAAAELGVFLNDLAFLQVPHHGSRRNLSPQLLDWISARIAYISTASEHTPKHPSQAVINEFLRRRTRVLCNQGRTLRYHRQAPDRGWKGAASEEFQSRFLA